MKMHLRTHGLAAAAVAALALSGLDVVPAHAEDAAAFDGLRLITPYNDQLAVSNGSTHDDFDGNNFDYNEHPAAVVLVAEVGNGADPGVPVTFAYNNDPSAAAGAEGWQEIGSAAVTGGYASLDWFVPREVGGPDGFALRVTSTSGGVTVTDVRGGFTVQPDAATVDFRATGPGFFPQPYASDGRTASLMRVEGNAAEVGRDVELSSWRTDTGEFGGRTSASVTPFGKNYGGIFTAAYDLADLDPADGDTVVLGARQGTDTARVVTLREQTLGRVEVAAQDTAAPNRPGPVHVNVYDAEGGAPVIGAEVRRLSDGGVAGWTDANGTVRTQQNGGTTETYYVNATDENSFEEGIDLTTPAYLMPTYEQLFRTAEPYLADGPVFDRDEASPGDVGVLVRDQRGVAMGAGTEVAYRLYPTGSEPPEVWQTATTNDDGIAPVVPDEGSPDGGYTLDYFLSMGGPTGSTQLTVGEAALSLEPTAGTAQAESGGTITWTGTLAVDGQPLAGRQIDLEYLRGVEHLPGRDADAGILTEDGRALTSTVTTDEAGSFTVSVQDAGDRRMPTESGGRLLVETGDTVATADSTVAGNAGEATEVGTQFGEGRGAAPIRRGGSSAGPRVDVVRAAGRRALAGETVKILRVLPGGKREEVATRTLDADATASARIPDLNRTDVTTYVVRLVASRRVDGATSTPIRLR